MAIRAHGAKEEVLVDVLEKVAARAHRETFAQKRRVFAHRQHENGQIRMRLVHLLEHVPTVHARHVHVEQHHVGLHRVGQLDALEAVARLADDFKVFLALQ